MKTVDITKESVKKILGRVTNQKLSGPDWLINFSSDHERVRRKKNLAMEWIDYYKKAYDMVQNSWNKECLDFFGVAENIKNFFRELFRVRRR